MAIQLCMLLPFGCHDPQVLHHIRMIVTRALFTYFLPKLKRRSHLSRSD
jgi:hypothetical protein